MDLNPHRHKKILGCVHAPACVWQAVRGKSRKKRLRQIGETFTEVQDDKANPERIALLKKIDWSALCETYSL